MKIIKNEEGFTLVETLVAIIIMVSAVSFIISFYLFAARFTRTTSLNLDERERINQFVYNLSNIINKSDEFKIYIYLNSVLLLSDEGKKITFSRETISIDKYYELKDIKKYLFSINLENGETITYDSNSNMSEEKNTSIEQIASMKIVLEYNSKMYFIEYHKPPISTLKFINIE